MDPASFSTLDAIHLAPVRSLARHVDRFVAYDARLVEAALEHGLDVLSPS